MNVTQRFLENRFNANGIWRRRYELSKQLQGLRINVALLLETSQNA
jgi:hypothetical protein